MSHPRFSGGYRIWVALGLAAIAVSLFSRAVFGGLVFFKRDIHLIWYPQVEAFVSALTAGSWPTWDPLAAFGQPLLADPSAQILYPFTWLNLLLMPWTYYTLFVVAHVWFTGVGVYALSRRWGLTAGASFIAAGVWMSCGPLQSFVDLWHHFAGACWIPWVFLGAEVALATRRPASTLPWAAAMTGQVLAGSADMCAITGLAVAAHIAVHRIRWKQGLDTENRRVALTAAAAAALALCLTAVLWLPALEIVSRAARRELATEVRTYWSLHPLSLLDLLFPNVWTAFVPVPPPGYLREMREPLLDSLYLGLPTLGLVSAALVARPRRRPWFLLFLAGASVLVALGRHAVFYDLLLAILPPVRILRYPVKALILVGFCWALLTGLGVDAWRQAALDPRRRRRLAAAAPLGAIALFAWACVLLVRFQPEWVRQLAWVTTLPSETDWLPLTARKLGVSAALATTALALALWHVGGGRASRWAGPLIALIALGDLLVYHHYLSLAPRLALMQRPEILSVLRTARDPRLYVYDYESPGASFRGHEPPYRLARVPQGWTQEQAGMLGMQMALAYAAAGRWKLRTGYAGDYRGLHPRPLTELIELLKHAEGTPLHVKLLRMGAVSHVVSQHQQGLEAFTALATLPGLFHDPIRLFAVPDPLPRTYLIGNVSRLSDQAALARLREPDWDPRRELILPEDEPVSTPTSPTGVARILQERPDCLALEAELDAPGYLVLVESYDPGWRARVDGRPTRMLRANLAFRAVPLPAGRHVVEFSYRPVALVAGLALSAAGGLVGIAVAAASRNRRRTAGGGTGALVR